MSNFTEKEIKIEAIIVIEEAGEINTTDLIKELRERMQPDGDDLVILAGRNDDKFSQKVRNLVSHMSGIAGIGNFVEVDRTVKPTLFKSKKFLKATAGKSKADVDKLLVDNKQKVRRRTVRKSDFETITRENRELGLLGEQFYFNIEVNNVTTIHGKKVSESVEHYSQEKGDGAGFDILSVSDVDPNVPKYIEVKTTKNSDYRYKFFMSINEKEFFEEHKDSYELVRVYNFDKTTLTGDYKVYKGIDIETTFDFEVNAYVVKFK